MPSAAATENGRAWLRRFMSHFLVFDSVQYSVGGEGRCLGVLGKYLMGGAGLGGGCARKGTYFTGKQNEQKERGRITFIFSRN